MAIKTVEGLLLTGLHRSVNLVLNHVRSALTPADATASRVTLALEASGRRFRIVFRNLSTCRKPGSLVHYQLHRRPQVGILQNDAVFNRHERPRRISVVQSTWELQVRSQLVHSSFLPLERQRVCHVPNLSLGDITIPNTARLTYLLHLLTSPAPLAESELGVLRAVTEFYQGLTKPAPPEEGSRTRLII